MSSDKRLFIDRKERKLLLESEVTKEFPFLVNLLEVHETISKDMVSNLSESERIFFADTLPTVLKTAQAEWHAESGCYDYGETSVPCTLCETRNRYIYYITNSISGRSINVGSDCVNDYFEDISNKKGKQGFALDKVQARQVRRLNEFYQYFPGASKMLESWTQSLNSLPIMIPNILESQIRELSFKGKMLIKEYQDRKRPDKDILDAFSSLINEYQKQNEKVTLFISDMSKEPWIVTKSVVDWLKQNNRNDVLHRLQSDCKIGLSTFSDIWEPSHVKIILPKLNALLSEINIDITSVDYSSNIFSLQYSGNLNLKLNISFSLILSILGPYVVGNLEPPLGSKVHDRILNNCTIKDESSIHRILLTFNESLADQGCVVPYYQPEYDESFIINTTNLTYTKQKLSVFLRLAISNISFKTKKDIRTIVKEIFKINNWYPVEMLSGLLNDRYGGKKTWYPLKESNVVIRLQERYWK